MLRLSYSFFKFLDHDFKLDPDFMDFTYEDMDATTFEIPGIYDVEDHDADTHDHYVGAHVKFSIG
jgi:hypothetical protein